MDYYEQIKQKIETQREAERKLAEEHPELFDSLLEQYPLRYEEINQPPTDEDLEEFFNYQPNNEE